MRSIKSSMDICGFSLIEILISIVILGILATSMAAGFFLVVNSQKQSENEAIAASLAQRYLEELRAEAETNFDGLAGLYSSPDFTAVPDFDGFEFNKMVTELTPPQYNLKKTQATIQWKYKGQSRSVTMHSLLTYPPEALPGNIDGYVKSKTTGNPPIGGASVTATNITNDRSLGTTTISTGANIGYYDFKEAGNLYQLEQGDWEITVTHDAYLDSDETGVSATCTVHSGQTTTVPDILLTPLSETGAIEGHVRNTVTGDTVNSIRVYVYQDGTNVFQNGNALYVNYNGTNNYKFNKLLPGNYTIGARTYQSNQLYLRRDGYTTLLPDKYLSTSPSDDMPVHKYPYWFSTAWEAQPSGWLPQAQDYDNASDPFGYRGGTSTDNVTVTPGNTTTLDINLDPIPKCTVTGIVVDGSNNPIYGAEVAIWWPKGQKNNKNHWRKYEVYDGYIQNATTAIDVNGDARYTMEKVPAPYFMFDNTADCRHIMRARIKDVYTSEFPLPSGPNFPYSSLDVVIGGTYNSQVYVQHNHTTGDVNFQLALIAPYKGNVEGYVFDEDSGEAINDALVQIGVGGKKDYSGANGYYLIEDIPLTSAKQYMAVLAYKNSTHYMYDSRWDEGRDGHGEAKYVTVEHGKTVQFHNFEMKPIVWADISGTVVRPDAQGDEPIEGASVKLTYCGSDGRGYNQTTTTCSGGNYIIEDKPATWWPGSWSTLRFSKTGFKSKTENNIKLKKGDNIIDAKLEPTTGGF